jgi:ribosomal protein S27AE
MGEIMSEVSPEMIIEEMMIALDTGRCPRCGEVLISWVRDPEWKLTCPGCHVVFGGVAPSESELEDELKRCN